MSEAEVTDRAKIFISYSRRDSRVFADELVAGLRLAGFTPFIDRHDIAATEDWEDRLGALIQEADSVVFVVSPEATRSRRCDWEVERAISLSKRVVPIVHLGVIDEQFPEHLRRLQFIRFDKTGFAVALTALVEALRLDLEWVREHTRIGDLAARWEARGRPAHLLIPADEVEAANRWVASRKKSAPALTELQREFLKASEQNSAAQLESKLRRLEEMAEAQATAAAALAEKERVLKLLSRRTTIGMAIAGGLTAVSTGLAYWGVDAEDRFQRAQKNSLDEFIRKEIEKTDISGQMSINATMPLSSKRGEELFIPPYHREFHNSNIFADRLLDKLTDRNTSIFSAYSTAASEIFASFNVGEWRPSISTDINGEIYLNHRRGGQRRKALVVGNLGGTERWAEFLKRCGFEVTWVSQLNSISLHDALGARLFEQPLQNSMFVLFYAGKEALLQPNGVSTGPGRKYLVSDDDIEKMGWRLKSGTELSGYAQRVRGEAAISILIFNSASLTLVREGI